ncbi:MAG: PAS domain-containing protein [bacterium]|nr:PAS domain-containing protein [bacterium]
MKFYAAKFKEFRKLKRYSVNDFCKASGISRSTLWEWESEKRSPSEANVRMLANILETDVSNISDIISKDNLSGLNISDSLNYWAPTADQNIKSREKDLANVIGNIKNINDQLTHTSIIVNALLSTMRTIFYLKGSDLKYIVVNKKFLNTLSIPLDFDSQGKDDYSFFAKKEAKNNSLQDKEVLLSQKPIINQEGYIPGTRKKKWGLISKLPILDANGKSAGIVGTFVDITERKNAEEIRRILEIAVNKSLHVVWLLTPPPHYKLFYVSESSLNMYGYPPDKFTTHTDFWLNHCLHPDDKKRLNKEWLDGTSVKAPQKRTFRIIRPDGSIRVIESTLINTKIKNCVAYIEQDITDKSKETIEYNLKLKIAASLKKDNIPISSIINATQLKEDIILNL